MRICIIIAAIVSAFSLSGTPGPAWAQDTAADKEQRELEELSKKLVRMKRGVDSFAKELTAAYSDQQGGFSGSYVRVDISESAKEYTVKADLPGMDKDKITVTLERGRILKIAGSREMVKEETGPNMVRRERMEGKFERVIELPAECKSDGITASYKNGVLEITIPKKEAAKPEMVKVNIQ